MTKISQKSGAPCPPSTSDFLEYHAIQTPNQVAIDWNDQTYTYAQVHYDLVRVTHALYRMGLRPGQLALIHQVNPYIQILLQLACENLRVASASLLNTKQTVLFNKAHVLLTCTPAQNLPIQVELVDDEWLSTVLAINPVTDLLAEIPPASFNDKVLVTRSSGTTGQPKLIFLTRGQLDYSIQGLARDRKFSSSTVCLVVYGFEVAIIWRHICACLRSGGTAVWGVFTTLAKKYQISHLWLLPVDVANFLDQLPANWEKSSDLIIYTAGAQLPEALRANACRRLCGNVINTYGANEVSVICEFSHDNTGTLKPGVEIRIVDHERNTVPIGVEGEIAVRTPGMIQSYWDQPEFTARHFRDGWFYPGDRGKLIQARMLQFLGRSDELLNLGGLKRPPESIENLFLSFAGVLQAAASSIQRSDGLDILLVAVVLKQGSDLEKVRRDAKGALHSLANHMRIIACDALPRTSNGKLHRLAIRDMVKDLS